MLPSQTPVLIVGAGPTGLVLALWLTKIGIKVRLIDKSSGPGLTSRAIVVHARTLEFYRQLGIADEVIARGFEFPHLNLWVNHQRRAQVSLGQTGRRLSPYSFVLIFPQDEHEVFLIERLKNLGVEVERQTELLSFQQEKDQVHFQLRLPSGETENGSALYLAGCDGAKSRVREVLNTGFEGSTYPDLFYVADIRGQGPALNGELHLSLDQSDFLAIFPLKEKGHARLIGVIRENESGRSLRWEDVNPRILREMDIQVDEVKWFSTYHVHHRVASHFQVGRAFLLGDAGHIHSPVGGQGMNTGIGDAVNLAWKLGEVLKGESSEELLESYEADRMPFAKLLVRTTDQAFKVVSSPGPWAQFVRTRVIPWLLPAAFQFEFLRYFLFRTVSQTGISYRHALAGLGQKLQPGDRLPWIESVDNFTPLKTLAWQVHVYGKKTVKKKKKNTPV
ncbi:MAG: FAD-dependent monooxygenase, partial [Pseudobdellovibrionaceae bacterium]